MPVLDLRSRPVADAFGAPVLRDQGLDRPAGHGKADHYGERILIRHIRGMRSSSKSARRQLNGRMEVTVVVRSAPGLSV